MAPGMRPLCPVASVPCLWCPLCPESFFVRADAKPDCLRVLGPMETDASVWAPCSGTRAGFLFEKCPGSAVPAPATAVACQARPDRNSHSITVTHHSGHWVSGDRAAPSSPPCWPPRLLSHFALGSVFSSLHKHNCMLVLSGLAVGLFTLMHRIQDLRLLAMVLGVSALLPRFSTLWPCPDPVQVPLCATAL